MASFADFEIYASRITVEDLLRLPFGGRVDPTLEDR